MVHHRSERVFAFASGLARLEPAVPASVEHVWAVASVSKPVSATVVLQLAEKGLLGLDTPLKEVLPEFDAGPGSERVLVRQLLSHSSGLVDAPDDDPGAGPGSQVAPDDFHVRLAYPPGTASAYATATFGLIERMVTRLTGLDYEAYTRRFIFEPLGMRDSSFRPGPEVRERMALPYDEDNNSDNWMHDIITMGPAEPGGGLCSTLADISRFGLAFLAGGAPILTPASHREMLTLQTGGLIDAMGQNVTWGLGWYLNRDGRPAGLTGVLSPSSYGHLGATFCWLQVDPERELVIAQVGNRLGVSLDETGAIQRELVTRLLSDL
jgi:CubicO group peptidase (beta-lactamase class C family)